MMNGITNLPLGSVRTTWLHRLRLTSLAAATVLVLATFSSAALQDNDAASAPPANQPAPQAVPASRQASKVAVITMHGGVDRLSYKSLERRIKEATDAGAEAIVLDINTPGGDAIATLDICALLKDRNVTPANTVAWIHPKAYSAGTIMALACREIVVAPNAQFGDAAPIQAPLGMLMQMAPAERAKIESPILQEVVNSARQNGYDENLVRAFVSVGAELWLLQNINTGERIFVDREEYRRVFGETPPEEIGTITPMYSGAPGGIMAKWRKGFDDMVGRGNDPFEAPLTPEQIEEEIEMTQQLPRSRDPLTEADAGDWQLLEQVVAGDQLLVLGPTEARDYGLAHAVIANDEELRAYFGAAPIAQGGIVRYDENWSEGLVRFLVNPWVRAVLIIIFLVCLFIELALPGTGVFGLTALITLVVLIGAPALMGLAQVWEIVAIGVGILLIAVELFIIPGFGVAGIAGVLALLVGLVATFVGGDLGSPAGQDQLGTGLMTTLFGLFVGGMIIWAVSRQVEHLPIFNKLVLAAELKDDRTTAPRSATVSGSAGIIDAMRPDARPDAAAPARGDTGVAITDLRPSGRADVRGRVVDVKSVGGFVEKGAAVRVVSVSRFVIEVEGVRA